MSIVAQEYEFVVGVDTHAKADVFALIDTHVNAQVGDASFPTSPAGLRRALAWVTRHAKGRVLFVIEGIGSYGASLARIAACGGYPVVEPDDMPARRGQGKSDPVDAARIARSVLGTDTTRLRQPRADQGIRAALRILVDARDMLNADRTRAVNTLTALVRIADLGLDARGKLSKTQIATIAAWHPRHEPLQTSTARTEAIRLARRIQDCDQTLHDNVAELTALVQASPVACLLDKKGIGPISAANIMTVWSHPGRIRDEASFAAIAGVNPIPASSGNTSHHRINHGGDRRLNRTLTVIANSRLRFDPETIAYAQRRTSQGMTKQDIKRILKRYIARQIYRLLEHQQHTQPTT